MLQAFNNYIKNNNLTNKNERILIGLSGGRDSIFMTTLFKNSNYNIAIAHCNFNLRGEEADNEQKFVENYAKQNSIEFFTTSFDTEKYASEKGISIQMAARELRYNWFEQIKIENNFDKIAIAHNKNDSVETFLINLTRGTGIKGLTGIKPINGNIIRPILFVERNEITNYLTENNISWKDDSSNNSDKYSRNNIRHNIIPEFEKMNSDFISTMSKNIEKLDSVYKVYNKEINFKRNKILIRQTDKTLINIEILKKLNPLKTYLFEFVKEFNFSPEQVHDIVEIIHSSSGKQVKSNTHRIIKDRDYLIITEINKPSIQQGFIIDKGTIEIKVPLHIHIDMFNNSNYKIPTNKNIACFDLATLNYPLKLRKWENGDKFKPFGMNNFKKLSDYFSDNKFSIVDKEKVWILTDNNNNIIWIVNNRTDNRYKITKETEKIIQFTFFE